MSKNRPTRALKSYDSFAPSTLFVLHFREKRRTESAKTDIPLYAPALTYDKMIVIMKSVVFAYGSGPESLYAHLNAPLDSPPGAPFIVVS